MVKFLLVPFSVLLGLFTSFPFFLPPLRCSGLLLLPLTSNLSGRILCLARRLYRQLDWLSTDKAEMEIFSPSNGPHL